MKVELFPFQRIAVDNMRMSAAMALNNYRMMHVPQVLSFTAPTRPSTTTSHSYHFHSLRIYPEVTTNVFYYLTKTEPRQYRNTSPQYIAT